MSRQVIVHSLGSQYSLGLSLRAVFEAVEFIAGYGIDLLGLDRDQWRTLEKLQQSFATEFSGQAFLTYKGRDAIEFALRAHGIGKGDAVITQAFTCSAIEEAIHRAQAKAVYVDLNQETLNPGVEQLNAAAHGKKNIKAVIIQHTLGYPAPVSEIAAWCSKKKILLIEDLAQAYGAKNSGKKLGSWGDIVITSFGRDKVVDAVSGGVVVIKSLPKDIQLPQLRKLSPAIIVKDMLYPIWTWMIRFTLWIGIGKVIHRLGKKLGIMTSPITSPTDYPTHLPIPHARIAWQQLHYLDEVSEHRLKIAVLYHQKLVQLAKKYPKIIKPLVDKKKLNISSNLRYTFWIFNPQLLNVWLLQENISLADRWYRQAVDCGPFIFDSDYKEKSCPAAESLAKHIFSFPTHNEIDITAVNRVLKSLESFCKEYAND